MTAADEIPLRQDRTNEAELANRVAELQGELNARAEQVAALHAAEGHLRAELEAARTETAEALAGVRAAQGRADERERLVIELKDTLERAQATSERAEAERAAVIAALGRRARKHLGGRVASQ